MHCQAVPLDWKYFYENNIIFAWSGRIFGLKIFGWKRPIGVVRGYVPLDKGSKEQHQLHPVIRKHIVQIGYVGERTYRTCWGTAVVVSKVSGRPDELSVVSSEALVKSVTLQGVVQHIYVSLFQKRERKTQDRLKSGIGKDLMKILRLKVPSGQSHRIGLKADGLGKISGS